MRKYYFPIIVYSALAAICFLYGVMAIFDFDKMTIADPVDLPQLISGFGFVILFAYIVIGYLNKED